jgi:hypothetical protein
MNQFHITDLRHNASSWKVAGLNPNEATRFFLQFIYFLQPH